MSSQPQNAATSNRPFMVVGTSARNYRGFEELEFTGWGGVNLLVGANGAGKSVLLRLIATGLCEFAQHLSVVENPLSLDIGDVRRGFKSASFRLNVKDKRDTYLYESECPKADPSPPTAGVSPPHGAIEHASYYSSRIHTGGVTLPVFAHYMATRSLRDTPVKTVGEKRYPPTSIYSDAFPAGDSYRSFFEWFRHREEIENQHRARGENVEDPQLRVVRHAVAGLMNGYSDLHLERESQEMHVRKGDTLLNLDQLSGGEKGLILLVADIARRLAIASGGNGDATQGPGVVLIDEVDLHLHPSWQRKVIHQLPGIFPNVQFFMTSHSPVVAGSAPTGSLFLVEEGQVKPQQFYGQDIGLVLDELFDTPVRDEQIQRQLDSLIDSIEAGNAEESRRELEALQAKLGTKDPDLTKARTRMRGLGIL